MKTTSKEIEKELDQTTRRLDELTEMRDGIATNLETLQKDFIGGKTSLDTLQAEQNKLTTLDTSIKGLRAKQTELHDAFQKASLSESRKKTLERMKVIADETETAFNEYVSLRTQFNETIRQDGEKMVDALSSLHSKQKEFAQSFREIAPGVTSFRPVPAEASASYGQVNSELKEIGLSGEKFNLATSTYQNLPKMDFGEIVGIIERFIGSGRFNAEQKQRQAASAADRAKRNAAQEAKQQEQRAESLRQLEAEQKRIAAYRAKNKMPLFSPADLALAARESLTAASAK
jgi:uncharacterized phage infection (PIP) family protein YhgE